MLKGLISYRFSLTVSHSASSFTHRLWERKKNRKPLQGLFQRCFCFGSAHATRAFYRPLDWNLHSNWLEQQINPCLFLCRWENWSHSHTFLICWHKYRGVGKNKLKNKCATVVFSKIQWRTCHLLLVRCRWTSWSIQNDQHNWLTFHEK